ncbi:MAG: PolC-type DNA polymerase III [Clostridia bacterium]|nr:PolC-type DNA polymerase III [Clostridia bacterium]
MSLSKPKLRDLFSQAKTEHSVMEYPVLAVGVKDNTFTVKLSGETPDSNFDAVRSAVCKAYSLDKIAFEFVSDFSESAKFKSELGNRYPSLSFGDDIVCLTVTGDRVDIDIYSSAIYIRYNDMKNEIIKCAHECLGTSFSVAINCKADIDNENEQKKKRDEQYSALLKELAEQEKAAAAAAPKYSDKPLVFEPKQRQEGKRISANDQQGNLIYGKVQNGVVIPLDDVSADSGRISVEGTLFFKEERQLSGKNKTVVSFDISDEKGALRISKVFDSEIAKKLMGELKSGMHLMVQGIASYSKFEGDVTVSPTAIVEISKPGRKDTAEHKRVELHLHTNMSNMDALCDPGAVIKLAAKMGHPAIAITDHGVVQAFPEAASAAKKNGIKVIYGIEAYCVNDIGKGRAVKGTSDNLINDEIIVFDLETTGLDPKKCEIIEIAAAKLVNGEITERYHQYVKPVELIPNEITKLTGISNEMVADARSIDTVLPEFLKFCSDSPLCAHNADFDISFLRAACRKLNIEISFCSIDTVEMARALMPELSKHKLNIIADAMGLQFNHHRASDDCDVLAEIFKVFVSRLENDYGISRIDEINQTLISLRAGDNSVHGRTYHFIILIKKQEGVRQLYKLVSDAHLKHFKRGVPIIPMSKLENCRENFIFGSACEAGELFDAIVKGKPWNELVKIASFYDYLEIQPISNNIFMLNKGMVSTLDQLKDFNRTVVKLGEALGKPVCATGDVHYIEKSDKIYRDILMKSKGFDINSDEQDFSFKSTDQMLEEFSYLGSKKAFEVVVTNPNKIAEMCDVIEPVRGGTYPPAVENSARDIEYLSRTKLKELYEGEDGVPKLISDRLEAELRPIINQGYDVMYMIAQKLVAKSNADGYLVGSRGSVGSSFVAFLSGITEVNALPPHYRCPKCKTTVFGDEALYESGIDMPDSNCPKCGTKMVKDGFNIPFATFLGFECDKAPDIDLNFSSEYQTRIHAETIRMFGVDRVFKAGTIAKTQDKTAFGYVRHFIDEEGLTPGKAAVNKLVQGCTGVKRTTGQHPGGLIIVPHDMEIYDFCPVQHPADKSSSEIITTHFDYHSIHDNLLKLDLLGHDDPTMIRRLYDTSGINPQTVPLDDPETMSIFTDISALGIETDDILEQTGAAAIPEFGTKFVRGMLTDTQPHTFAELVRISGLSHGTDVWLNNAADIIKRGDGTLKDVICVRDDITLYLMQKGLEPKTSFTISESVRKGKGLKPDWETLMREHDVPEWYITSCKTIKYMFPRAHAVAYVTNAFRIAWFKVHRPLDFYGAYFAIRSKGFDGTYMGNGDAEVCKRYRSLKAQGKRSTLEDDVMSCLEICHEFYKRGFSFLPVDIYKSDVKNFIIEGNALRMPFTSIPGLGEAAAQSIVEERKNGRFMSVEDITSRCDKVSKAVVESLDLCGALNGIPKTNQLNLFDGL